MEYTKGPWKVEVDEYDGSTNIATETQNIAKMCFDDAHTLNANANLIASAPDMYEALKELSELITPYASELGLALDFVNKALSKANGQ